MPKKVLLVDDSTTTLMMEEMILRERTTYQCVTEADIAAQERGERDGKVSVLTCPDCGGVLWQVNADEFVEFRCHTGHMYTSQAVALGQSELLEKSLSQTPIILVTTRGEEEYVEAGFQSGCNDYITKPINSFELVTLLQNYLGE